MRLSDLDKKIIKEVREQYKGRRDLHRRNHKLEYRLKKWGLLDMIFGKTRKIKEITEEHLLYIINTGKIPDGVYYE
jgi:hypothetical protein